MNARLSLPLETFAAQATSAESDCGSVSRSLVSPRAEFLQRRNHGTSSGSTGRSLVWLPTIQVAGRRRDDVE